MDATFRMLKAMARKERKQREEYEAFQKSLTEEQKAEIKDHEEQARAEWICFGRYGRG